MCRYSRYYDFWRIYSDNAFQNSTAIKEGYIESLDILNFALCNCSSEIFYDFLRIPYNKFLYYTFELTFFYQAISQWRR